MFKTIVFPIDRSRESREAVDVVVDVVKTYQARLVVVSVVEPPSDEEESTSKKEQQMASPEAIAELLEAAKKIFSQQGIEAEVIEREGVPAFVICDVADEVGGDLIIMGCRGLGLTDEGASDSVTNRVINLSPCPVLVVP